MQKRVIFGSIISILILASFVFAAGTSTSENTVKASASSTQTVIGRTTCEDVSNLKERIKCRMENKATISQTYSVEEACRGRNGTINEEKCSNLYKRLKENKCYEIENAVAKKKCFLIQSGININQGGTFRAAPNEEKRSYVVTLLYELQEKIEKLQEEGKITMDESADLISQIVTLKQAILDGRPRSEIVPKLQEFRLSYNQAINEGEQ